VKLEPVAILSRTEEERLEKLGAEFRRFQRQWLVLVMSGCKWTPGLSKTLAMVFLEHAALALIAPSDAAAKEADDKTADRCLAAARAAFEVLEREVLS
jgi:hypothetical protein